jgi:aspartyl-tRNA(Asn)/glutamyl-tRNA(Gln) amidotransferase subunit B
VMAARFVKGYGLPEYDAGQLTQNKATAAYFEAVAAGSKQAKLASNWVMGELSRRLNSEGLAIENAPVPPEKLSYLISKIADGTISNTAAKTVFDSLWSHPGSAWAFGSPAPIHLSAATGTASTDNEVDALIDSLGLKQMNDTGALEKIIDDVLAANAKNVAEFRGGNTKAFNALVGQAMKATQGKANPAQVNELLKKKLG